MKVHTIDGHEVEITLDEAKRIHGTLSGKGQMAAPDAKEKYHKDAFHNILERAKAHHIVNVEDKEDDMKKLLLCGIQEGDAELIGEIIEWFISEHDKKVGA